MIEHVSEMKDVFKALNDLVVDGVIVSYAIGGAMAVLVYAEPISTYDLDVYVIFPPKMNRTYSGFSDRGQWPDVKHVIILGTPMQFLLALDGLAEEAVHHALTHNYAGVPIRVIGPEHLIGLLLRAGGYKPRAMAAALLELAVDQIDQIKLDTILNAWGLKVDGLVDNNLKPATDLILHKEVERIFASKKEWHKEQARLPLRKKLRILLQMQRDHFPILKNRQGGLRSWEYPWNVLP